MVATTACWALGHLNPMIPEWGPQTFLWPAQESQKNQAWPLTATAGKAGKDASPEGFLGPQQE